MGTYVHQKLHFPSVWGGGGGGRGGSLNESSHKIAYDSEAIRWPLYYNVAVILTIEIIFNVLQ